MRKRVVRSKIVVVPQASSSRASMADDQPRSVSKVKVTGKIKARAPRRPPSRSRPKRVDVDELTRRMSRISVRDDTVQARWLMTQILQTCSSIVAYAKYKEVQYAKDALDGIFEKLNELLDRYKYALEDIDEDSVKDLPMYPYVGQIKVMMDSKESKARKLQGVGQIAINYRHDMSEQIQIEEELAREANIRGLESEPMDVYELTGAFKKLLDKIVAESSEIQYLWEFRNVETNKKALLEIYRNLGRYIKEFRQIDPLGSKNVFSLYAVDFGSPETEKKYNFAKEVEEFFFDPTLKTPIEKLDQIDLAHRAFFRLYDRDPREIVDYDSVVEDELANEYLEESEGDYADAEDEE